MVVSDPTISVRANAKNASRPALEGNYRENDGCEHHQEAEKECDSAIPAEARAHFEESFARSVLLAPNNSVFPTLFRNERRG
jgi:hypothetical protein